MAVAIYPGCSLNGSAREYMESVKAIFEHLKLKVEEVDDWNCCGATAAHNLDHTLAISLPSRILSQAGKDGYKDLLVPCAACYNRLKTVRNELASSEELKQKVTVLMEQEFNIPENILNILDYLTA